MSVFAEEFMYREKLYELEGAALERMNELEADCLQKTGVPLRSAEWYRHYGAFLADVVEWKVAVDQIDLRIEEDEA